MFRILFILLTVGLLGCKESHDEVVRYGGSELHDAMQALTDIVVHDIFSPPVASRIYAYPCIAAYEVLATQDSTYLSLVGQVNDLKPIPKPEKEPINYEVAAIHSFLLVAREMIFSEDKMNTYIDERLSQLEKKKRSSAVRDNSIAYAKQVSEHIILWAGGDNYKQTRTYQKYATLSKAGNWQPTPPAYMEAIEPYWNEIRPFVIDSANQFVPEPPTEYNLEESSQFYQEVIEVYKVGKNLTEEQAAIASFWDCNPFVMNVQGHVMIATKKITPGGHWIGIAKTAAEKSQADLLKTAQAYALTSIVLADAFISCWDEKYRSNLIRPETVINRHIDEEWKPLLQTPPFPEYTSGHSVISGAAGVALTSIFGDNFHFIDSTEVKYGLPPREFNSFNGAAEEAAISRLYGGIHYSPAINNGLSQGRELGRFIVSKIKMRAE